MAKKGFFNMGKQQLPTAENAYKNLLSGSDRTVVDIDVNLIDEIKDQPQSIHEDKIERIAESMKAVGQIDPVTVIKNGERYTLLAGRHRRRACIKNGSPTVKAIVSKETDPNKQRLILLCTNNDRDTTYKLSELAKSYTEQAELLKKLGVKSKISAIADNNNISRRTVERTMKLSNLKKPLLDRVDNRMIEFMAGVELSYLNEAQQIMLINFLLNHSDIKKINFETAKQIRLTPDNLMDIFYPSDSDDFPTLSESDDEATKVRHGDAFLNDNNDDNETTKMRHGDAFLDNNIEDVVSDKDTKHNIADDTSEFDPSEKSVLDKSVQEKQKKETNSTSEVTRIAYEKPKTKKITISLEIYDKYFNGKNEATIERILQSALEKYYEV